MLDFYDNFMHSIVYEFHFTHINLEYKYSLNMYIFPNGVSPGRKFLNFSGRGGESVELYATTCFHTWSCLFLTAHSNINTFSLLKSRILS
jgi:hypothetical protein